MLRGRLPVFPANSVGRAAPAHKILPAESRPSASGTGVHAASGGSRPREPPIAAPALVANMASLLAKDAYLQDLAKKICSQSGPERQRSKWGKASGPSSFWERTRSYETCCPRSRPDPLQGIRAGGRKGFSSGP